MERLFEKFADEIGEVLTRAQDEIANAAVGYKDKLFDEMDEQVQDVEEELERTKKELEQSKKELADSQSVTQSVTQSLKEEIEQLKEQLAKSQSATHSLEGQIKKLKMDILRKDSVIQAQTHRIKELQTDEGVWQTITHSVKKEQAGKEELLFSNVNKALRRAARAITPGKTYCNPLVIEDN